MVSDVAAFGLRVVDGTDFPPSTAVMQVPWTGLRA